MFRSFRARILAVTIGVVLLTTATLIFLVSRETDWSLSATQDESAQNLLRSLRLTALNGHRSVAFYRKKALEKRKRALRDITSLADAAVQQYHEQQLSGMLSQDEAQDMARAALRRMRYDNQVGYIWLNNLEKPLPRLLMHPTLPELEGKLLVDKKYYCALGRKEHLLKAFADTCLRDGEGYVDYVWPKPTPTGLLPDQAKLSHVRLFKPWGWVIGSGVYIDDIEKDAQDRLDAVLDELSHTCREMRIGRSGYIYIFDRTGRMLVHPEFIGQDAKHSGFAKLINEHITSADRQPLDYEWAKPGEPPSKRFKKRAYVTHIKSLDWYICVSVYLDEVAEPSVRLGRRMLLTSLAVLAVAIILAAVLSKNLATPLRNLKAAAELAKERGSPNVQFPVAGSTETRELGQIMGQLMNSLHAAQLSLREREEDLRITLNSIGDGVIATDSKGKITRLNPVAERMLGWTQEEAMGLDLDECFRIYEMDTGECVQDPFELVMASGDVISLPPNTRLMARDGTERMIADSGAPIRHRDGKIVGVVLVFRDVTEQLQLEEQLRHAHKMDSVGQLAGGIAHDFNNMLAGISGAAELLGSKLEDESSGKLVHIIIDAAHRASDLTQKLLTFSRKGKFVSTPIDIHDVINEAVTLLSRTIDKRIEIEQQLDSPQSTVIGDPSQLQNAILNLGVNARDAMKDGGTLSIRTRQLELDKAYCERSPFAVRPGPYIEISIRDTGCGIPTSIRERIFEPFFTTKAEGEGTGLGLAAVYGCIEDHQGELHLHSETNKGTTFRICLPVEETIAGRRIRREGQIIHGKGRCILLVDDELIVRTTGMAILQDLGYKVIPAQDGQEAIGIYEKEHESIDLILLDIVMPRMGGRDAMHALMKINPNTPVVFTSGFNRDQSIEQLIDEGATGFIQKPYTRSELSRTLAAALPAKD